MNALWVALGSAIGGVARYWMTEALTALFGAGFLWGIVMVNVMGSFIIGWFAAATAPGGIWPVSYEGRLFVMAGICGGFTTFSSFSLQSFPSSAMARPCWRWPIFYCRSVYAWGRFCLAMASARVFKKAPDKRFFKILGLDLNS